MGLSNNQSYQNIFQEAYNNNEITSELYGLVINPLPFTSYLIFGNIDSQILDNVIWVTPVDNQKWQFYINLFLINGVDYSDMIQQNAYGNLSSGTPCLVVNNQLFNVITNDYLYPAGCINNYNTFYCPCWNEKNASLPNITIFLNQVTINVPYQNLFLNFYESPPGDICQVCLDYSYDNSIILGGPVFQSVIPIFNKASNQVGFLGGVQNNIPDNGNS